MESEPHRGVKFCHQKYNPLTPWWNERESNPRLSGRERARSPLSHQAALHESRAIGEWGFASRSFYYIAPRFYDKLPVTVKLIDSPNAFKSHLKAFLFTRAYDQPGLTVQEDYAL